MSSKTLHRQAHTKVDEELLETYTPVDGDRQDIVDVLCNIMEDDGPPPMKDMRPAQKTRNGADQFYADHQDPYESRFKQSRDRVESVHLHNSGYPKMHDELKKKRSIAKPVALSSQKHGKTQQAAYNICNACMKKRKGEPKQRVSVHKYTRERKPQPRQAKTRISKLKSRKQRHNGTPCKIYRLSRIRTHRGCQCSKVILAKDKESETGGFPFERRAQNNKMAECCLQCHDAKPECSDTRKLSRHPSNTSQSSKDGSYARHKRDSENSVSSYNSYASLEHEPMVSN